ncbi:MAG: FAD-dependent thymidylate synthase [Planctomycetota bacterium]|nr:FAD-dependent thymidylate synthase [Planctomycetota bacterium]
MPKTVELKHFRIAETKVDPERVRAWLDHLGAYEFDPFEGQYTENHTPDSALLIALAAKRCYMSFEVGLNPNVTKVRSEWVDYFDNILKSGHGSVLEHAVFSFAIEGVSRVFTGEMNRHRAGWAISEGSMRFIRFDKDISFWMPTSIQDQPGDSDSLKDRKAASRDVFMAAFKQTEELYSQLLDIWDMTDGDHDFAYKKKVTSCLRRIVPMGVATGGVWTGNVRALRHVLAMRCSPAAEEEIAEVFTGIARELVKDFPLMFGDFSEENGYFAPKYPKV